MKLWRVSWIDENGRSHHWAPCQKEAARLRERVAGNNISTTAFHIGQGKKQPTRADVAAFLNTHGKYT